MREIAFFLRLKGENAYKARAYEKAAFALLHAPHEATELVSAGILKDVPGIGPATSMVIADLVTLGESSLHRELQGDFPASLVELDAVPGLSIKQILRLYRRADVRSLEDLRRACQENRLIAIPGFGPKLQTKLLAALGEYERGQGFQLYANVLVEAEQVEAALRAMHNVESVTLTGAIRRKLEVVDELCFVMTLNPPATAADLAEYIRAIPNITEVACKDQTIIASSPSGLPIVINTTRRQVYGRALWQATGNAEHLMQMRQRFIAHGLQESDLDGEEEADIYRRVGLSFIPPELREGRGEIEHAESAQPPQLLDISHIQGCFHLHTDYTDGADTIEAMVAASRRHGYRYVGLSDHSQSAFYVNGLKEDRIRAQWQEIDAVQKKYPDVHIFKGIEADILPDGAMDYSDDLLAQFDFVIASVHSRFNLSEDDQTRRICRALANPYVTILGHPTGRLLLSRPGYRVDMTELIKTAAEHGKLIEINGSRYRLDLDWRWARIAKIYGVRFCVSPDAHAVTEFSNVALGVNVARKAGLGTADVVNTWPLKEMENFLRTRHSIVT